MSYTHREVELLQWIAKQVEVGRVLELLKAEQHRLKFNRDNQTLALAKENTLPARIEAVQSTITIIKEEKDRIKEIISQVQRLTDKEKDD